MRRTLQVIIVLLVAAGLGVGLGLTTIKASQQGVVFRFGRPVGKPLLPGLHFVLPLADRVERVEVTRTLTMPVGFRLVESSQGIPATAEQSQWLTGDTNILSVQASIQYQIADATAFLTAAESPQEVLRRAGEAAVNETLGVQAVDDALSGGRLLLVEKVRSRTQALLDRHGLGLGITSVTLRALDPPPDVAPDFQEVQNARSDRERLINEAQGYANDVLPKARGEAEAEVTAAGGERDSRIARARGDAERFESLRRDAAAAPALLRQRLYLEAVEKLLPGMQMFVAEREGKIHFVQSGDGGGR